MRSEKPRAWDDTRAMIETLESRRSERLPLWSVYSYDRSRQYEGKLRWYADRLERLAEPGSILDLGCGTGEILRWYEAPVGYVGLDVVPGLIEQAKVDHPARRFECVDALTVPLARFDTVIMVGLLGLSPQPIDLIERACSLAKHNVLFDFLVDLPQHRNSSLTLRYLSQDLVESILARDGLEVVGLSHVGANVRVVVCRSSTARV